jgi:hypothetical protein
MSASPDAQDEDEVGTLFTTVFLTVQLVYQALLFRTTFKVYLRLCCTYDTIFTDRINPIFCRSTFSDVVRHLKVSYDTIFTNIFRIV